MKTILTALTIIITMTIQAQETATFGGGCFWCTEAVFDQLKGVSKVESGYSGGEVKNPSYKDVCTGLTGHAEVIQITFDPEVIAFEDLLEVFFATHDPTTLNRQGADVGTQYRSVVFYHNEKQKEITELVIKSLDEERIFDSAIVTEVSAFDTFYKAENYHQDYFANNASQPYCRAVIVPKMDKFKKLFKEKIK
ncbi:peptide-methionine (S)-S-oxide reductase MsrA [Carboxylicivirga linearis]|uniref:Peptide methionine sulfoxide reductase MsrA n=1 Tax=Carboxylicivirga linearis TaxID=1628157 RepID=A0ABS5JSD7_9BACT|nr:peptide-methionine (S)-S-oxide reductase MsrA [Carboxylicivirga linearis]MBS2097479.1 peptide-methionine (S)-S-oxide reductase MsrA [Carboxylicivirga linearis]